MQRDSLQEGSADVGQPRVPTADTGRSGSLSGGETTPDQRGHANDARREQGILGAIRERAIDPRRLSWPLRLVVAFSIVAALGVAALIALRDVPQPHLTLFFGHDSSGVPIPTAAFVVALALWLVAWSFALTGAIHGHWALRVVVFAAFIYVMIEAVLLDVVTVIYIAPLVIILVWMLAISIVRAVAARTGRQLPRRLPAVTFALVFVLFALHYALVLLLDLLVDPAARAFELLVSNEFEAYAIALVPILFLTGTDFAEWSQVVAGQLNAWLRRFRASWPLVVVTVLVAAGILTHELILRGSFAPFDLPSALDLVVLGLFGLIATLLYLAAARLGRLRAWPRLSVPPGVLVAATVVIMALLTGPAYITDFVISLSPPAGPSVDYTVLRHTAGEFSPAFSLIYPSDWQHALSEPKSAEDPVLALFGGSGTPGDPQVLLAGVPVSPEGGETLAQFANDAATGACEDPNCTATLTPAPDHGPWQVESSVVQDQHAGAPVERDGWVWTRQQGDELWALYGSATPDGTQAAQPIFTAMVDSWRPDLSATVPPTPVSPIVSRLENVDPSGVLSLGLVPIGLAVLVGLPLLLWGRRRPGAASVAGLFFVLLGLNEGLLYLPQILTHLGVPADKIVLFALDPAHKLRLSTIPTLSLPVLQTLAAFFSLLTVGWLLVRRRLGSEQARHLVASLLLLNAGLQILAWLDLLFATSDQVTARFTVAQGILLVLAFLWDLLTSGGQVTNAEGRQSPRFARVLIYVGYSLLSFSQVLFFSTLAASKTPFSLGDWTDIGLTVLGVPLLLTVVAMRITRRGASQTEPAAQPAHVDASLVAVTSRVP